MRLFDKIQDVYYDVTFKIEDLIDGARYKVTDLIDRIKGNAHGYENVVEEEVILPLPKKRKKKTAGKKNK